MKTTVEIASGLLAEAKARAAEEGTTLRALIEQGLRDVLAEPVGPRHRKYVPVTASLEPLPGVDPNDFRAMIDASYEREDHTE